MLQHKNTLINRKIKKFTEKIGMNGVLPEIKKI